MGVAVGGVAVGGVAIGGMTVSEGTVGLVSSLVRDNTNVLLDDWLATLLVSADVEVDEEEEVRSKEGAAEESSVFLASAGAVGGHAREVGRSEVGVAFGSVH